MRSVNTSTRTLVAVATIIATIAATLFIAAGTLAAPNSTAPVGPAAVLGPIAQDYNHDGYQDLAIGSPNDDVVRGGTQFAQAGVVNVLYGSPSGLTATGTTGPNTPHSQVWSQDSANVADLAETGDHFGAAVAAGDFNGDGFSDLAIGVPGEDNSLGVDSGVVNILFGSEDGLVADPRQDVVAANVMIATNSVPDAHAGAALVSLAGYGQAGATGLAFGMPGYDSGAGAVEEVAGDAINPDADGGTGGFVFSSQAGCSLGASLAAGQLDNNAAADVVAGMPDCNRDLGADGTARRAGGVAVIFNNSPAAFLYQDAGFLGVPETGDHLGASVAVGDMNGDGVDDVIAGVPGQDIGAKTNAGVVEVAVRLHDRSGFDVNQLDQISRKSLGSVNVANARFGTALASSDAFSPAPLLAIGEPGDVVNGQAGAGSVWLIAGSAHQLWTQNTTGVLDASETDDGFGSTLVIGDYDRNFGTDLAIGVPLEDVAGITNAGAVTVLYAKYNQATLRAKNNDFWSQNSPDVGEKPQAGDHFGSSLR